MDSLGLVLTKDIKVCRERDAIIFFQQWRSPGPSKRQKKYRAGVGLSRYRLAMLAVRSASLRESEWLRHFHA